MFFDFLKFRILTSLAPSVGILIKNENEPVKLMVDWGFRCVGIALLK